jgi:hypothetical protein
LILFNAPVNPGLLCSTFCGAGLLDSGIWIVKLGADNRKVADLLDLPLEDLAGYRTDVGISVLASFLPTLSTDGSGSVLGATSFFGRGGRLKSGVGILNCSGDRIAALSPGGVAAGEGGA